jgi:hypothetical protein
MDLKFDWWFFPLWSLLNLLWYFLSLTPFLFVFGLIFLFSYFISRLFLEVIETLFKWQPLLEKRSKRHLVVSLAILIFVAILALERYLEITQSTWSYLLLCPSLLSEFIKSILSIRV